MKQFLLPQDLFEHLVRFLASKPYAEVQGFMEAFKTLKEAPDVKEEKKE